jgi:hypothetical protein
LELSSIRQVGIIFPAINQAAKVLREKQDYRTKEELEEMQWQVLLLLI